MLNFIMGAEQLKNNFDEQNHYKINFFTKILFKIVSKSFEIQNISFKFRSTQIQNAMAEYGVPSCNDCRDVVNNGN